MSGDLTPEQRADKAWSERVTYATPPGRLYREGYEAGFEDAGVAVSVEPELFELELRHAREALAMIETMGRDSLKSAPQLALIARSAMRLDNIAEAVAGFVVEDGHAELPDDLREVLKDPSIQIPRDQAVQMMLGRHARESSDPCTWCGRPRNPRLSGGVFCRCNIYCVKILERTHCAYPDSKEDNYQAACWDCGWRGHLQSPDRDGKDAARAEAGEHEATMGRVLEIPIERQEN